MPFGAFVGHRNSMHACRSQFVYRTAPPLGAANNSAFRSSSVHAAASMWAASMAATDAHIMPRGGCGDLPPGRSIETYPELRRSRGGHENDN